MMFSLDPEIVRQTLGDARIATWEWFPSSDKLRWTSGQTEIYSRPSSEIDSSAAWEALVHPDDRERLRLAVQTAIETETGFREQFRVIGPQGRLLWIFGYARVGRLPDQTLRMTGLNIDLTDWAVALADAEDRFTTTFEQAAVGIAHIGIDGQWLKVNQRWCEIVGYSKGELKKLTFADITHPEDLHADWERMRALLDGERSSYSIEKRYFTKRKQLVWVNLTVSLVLRSDGSPDHFITVIEDITSRKALEDASGSLIQQLAHRVSERTAQLEKLSLTDALTGIANRRRLDEYLESEWDRAVRARQPISVVIVDIDHFKGLNDELGHGEGDKALKVIAAELTCVLQRAGDLATRYGGDEFVVVLPNTNPEGAFKVANDIQSAIAKLAIPHPGSPIDTKITTSLGIATAWPLKKGAANGLMFAADRALYSAKRAGRNRIAVAGPAMLEPENI
jgi:diguanylate cyclase (GGDEF)-like protein/PAS domain S-box-containing protein